MIIYLQSACLKDKGTRGFLSTWVLCNFNFHKSSNYQIAWCQTKKWGGKEIFIFFWFCFVLSCTGLWVMKANFLFAKCWCCNSKACINWLFYKYIIQGQICFSLSPITNRVNIHTKIQLILQQPLDVIIYKYKLRLIANLINIHHRVGQCEQKVTCTPALQVGKIIWDDQF